MEFDLVALDFGVEFDDELADGQTIGALWVVEEDEKRKMYGTVEEIVDSGETTHLGYT